jgi:hypothetical protein
VNITEGFNATINGNLLRVVPARNRKSDLPCVTVLVDDAVVTLRVSGDGVRADLEDTPRFAAVSLLARAEPVDPARPEVVLTVTQLLMSVGNGEILVSSLGLPPLPPVFDEVTK